MTQGARNLTHLSLASHKMDTGKQWRQTQTKRRRVHSA